MLMHFGLYRAHQTLLTPVIMEPSPTMARQGIAMNIAIPKGTNMKARIKYPITLKTAPNIAPQSFKSHHVTFTDNTSINMKIILVRIISFPFHKSKSLL